MSSFMQKARERAMEAAAKAQDAASSFSGAHGSPNASQASGHGSNSTNNNSGVGGYTGALPHVLRQGVAQFYPRSEFDSRSSHVLSSALKSVSIDHEALARETKTAAKSAYLWGQDQDPYKREDGAGDAALVDVMDRLAFLLTTVGDLETAHVSQLEAARSTFKRVVKAEADLASKRERRVKIQRELATLMPEQAKGNRERIGPLEAKLKEFEQEDREAEEELGRLKRESIRDSFETHFDALAVLGEKLSIVARHGKLLTHQLPVYAPPFPAPRVKAGPNEPLWPGASRTAAIRAAVGPALAAYHPAAQLPELDLPAEGGPVKASLSRKDTESYGVSHAAELSDQHIGSSASSPPQAGGGDLQRIESSSSVTGQNHAASGFPLSPPQGSPNELLSNINNAPANLPSSPPIGAHTQPQRHRVPPIPSPTARPADASNLPPAPSHETDVKGDLATGPIVAETGQPIVGPGGPSSGQLSPRVPRKPSVTAHAATASGNAPSVPTADSTAAAASSSSPLSAQPASYYETTSDARARKEAEAARERKEAEARAEQEQVRQHVVSARLRRDGTIVRRGEQGFAEAEEENLPPYHE
ncbi:hypothetical protein CBOM_05980 [Ceraceosorus bombacis]|uniref:Eisosome component PIL1-domain-containing protein n=1 Tax=Ceraceosorus bombacis TaxID=401625 RepID=A0A0P1BIB3_9BASI|nr:hypothetical protein CBOM_05980 [Ceraceosorus bombacis]